MENPFREVKGALATHVPLLTRVFDISEGDVLEIGTGYFSTLLLHWLSTMSKRHVYSYESKDGWYQKALKYNKNYHHIVLCKNWESADFVNKHWGVVFVDHSPEARRHVDVARLKDKADYIVIHDTSPECDEIYQYSKIWPLFKYRYDYTKIAPNTSVVSNFKNLKNIP